MDKVLILTVGLPRSGKSTWAESKGFPIVNPDSVRLALHGEAFIAEAEKMVWTVSYYMVKALFIAGHDHVILDATNTTRKRREFWKSDGWIRKYRLFAATGDECIDRCKDREDLIPVIARMLAEFEPLEDDEWD